ncbi:MAG: RrF2 family transcriptional regulator [Planctomycetota bacterium]
MLVSQKDRYAFRALFELAKRGDGEPVKVADIAEAQSIPSRFLEVILHELKGAGFVGSRRGKHGGYLLVRDPARLTLGDVMRFLEGPIEVARRDPDDSHGSGPGGFCVFEPIWGKMSEAIADVFDGTTFAELVEEEKRRAETYVPTYAI